jgi:pyruvate ferredoxin oxidoreductase delta subunit
MEKGAIIKHDISKSPKTGDWRYMVPELDKDVCIGCQTCVQFCPEACMDMVDYKDNPKKKADIDYEVCKGCGVCAQVCPVKAISMRK